MNQLRMRFAHLEFQWNSCLGSRRPVSVGITAVALFRCLSTLTSDPSQSWGRICVVAAMDRMLKGRQSACQSLETKRARIECRFVAHTQRCATGAAPYLFPSAFISSLLIRHDFCKLIKRIGLMEFDAELGELSFAGGDAPRFGSFAAFGLHHIA